MTIIRITNKEVGAGCVVGTIETICGDCLIPLDQCSHAKEYKR